MPSVVSSLWSAPDQATQKLMTSFYEELKDGNSKAEALRNAKLTYIQKTKVDKLRHPYFWAGFVLHGNSDAVEFTSSQIADQLLILGVVVFNILIVLWLVRERKSRSTS